MVESNNHAGIVLISIPIFDKFSPVPKQGELFFNAKLYILGFSN